MADSDDRLARRYRDLAREEPPAAVDAAILAAARASVRPRVGNRWAGPVSIAAVLVLGIGVSLRMQIEQPGIETSVPTATPPSEYSAPGGADVASSQAPARDAQPQAKANVALPQVKAKEAQAPAKAQGAQPPAKD